MGSAIAIVITYLIGLASAWLFCAMAHTAAHDLDETPSE